MQCGLGVVLDVIPSFTKMNSPFFSLLFPQLDLYDLGDGKLLKVNVSEPKTRLFIGNIPKSKGKEEIEEEFNKLSGKCHTGSIHHLERQKVASAPFSSRCFFSGSFFSDSLFSPLGSLRNSLLVAFLVVLLEIGTISSSKA